MRRPSTSTGPVGPRPIAAASWPMVAAAFPQLAPMVLVGLNVFTYNTGLWIAYAVAVLTLASGLYYVYRMNRLERLPDKA